MEKVIFDYNCEKTIIECNNNEILENIIKRFKEKRSLKKENLFYVKDAKKVHEELTFEQLANYFDKIERSMNIFVFDNIFDDNIIKIDISNNKEKEKSQSNYLNYMITKMRCDINELGKNLGLVQLFKQDIQMVQNELREIKSKMDENQGLNEQIKKNKNINDTLLSEIKNNTIRNNELLQEIKNNININNQLKNEIAINNNTKNGLKKYIDELIEKQNQSLQNITVRNSESLQNYKIGTIPNSIVKIEKDGKIYPNIIFTKGMIIAWFGSPNNIPKDWAICDGTNGTPDLRNRFIIGPSDTIPFNSNGGNSSIILKKENLPSIGNGRFSADSHRGSYHHSNNGFIKSLGSYATYIRQTDNGDNWGTNWEIDLNTGMNSSPINIINPYLALFYIMKL